MKHDEAVNLVRALAPAIKEFVTASVAPLTQRLAVLEVEQRVTRLEERRAMAFEGAFELGRSYSVGDVVQRQGCLFVATTDAATEQPGESSQWRKIGVCK